MNLNNIVIDESAIIAVPLLKVSSFDEKVIVDQERS
jgi:hypothetical protein